MKTQKPLQIFEEVGIEDNKSIYHTAFEYIDIFITMILDEDDSERLIELQEATETFYDKIYEFSEKHTDDDFVWDTEEHKVHKENAHLYTDESYAKFLEAYEEAEVLMGVLRGRAIVDADVDVIKGLVRLDAPVEEPKPEEKEVAKKGGNTRYRFST